MTWVNIKPTVVFFSFFLLVAGCSKDNGQMPEEKEEEMEPKPEEYPPVVNHFTVSPIPIDKLVRISKAGDNAKILPIGHTYWHTCDFFEEIPSDNPCLFSREKIFSPGDGIVQAIDKKEDGGISFTVNPTFYWGFSHVTPVTGLDEGDSVVAGQYIGDMFDQTNFDFGIINTYIVNDFVNKDRYPPPLLNSQHPIDQFSGSLKKQLLAKLPGPYDDTGTVSYDKAGTAAGNWFKPDAPPGDEVFTPGHGDKMLYLGRFAERPETMIIHLKDVWVKDSVTPTYMAVGPDETQWEEITPASGKVQLKLFHFIRKTALTDSTYTNGSVLVQMENDSSLEIEWFNTHEVVNEFTSASKKYIR